jgi:hypothetical protein
VRKAHPPIERAYSQAGPLGLEPYRPKKMDRFFWHDAHRVAYSNGGYDAASRCTTALPNAAFLLCRVRLPARPINFAFCGMAWRAGTMRALGGRACIRLAGFVGIVAFPADEGRPQGQHANPLAFRGPAKILSATVRGPPLSEAGAHAEGLDDATGRGTAGGVRSAAAWGTGLVSRDDCRLLRNGTAAGRRAWNRTGRNWADGPGPPAKDGPAARRQPAARNGCPCAILAGKVSARVPVVAAVV